MKNQIMIMQYLCTFTHDEYVRGLTYYFTVFEPVDPAKFDLLRDCKIVRKHPFPDTNTPVFDADEAQKMEAEQDDALEDKFETQDEYNEKRGISYYRVIARCEVENIGSFGGEEVALTENEARCFPDGALQLIRNLGGEL